MKPLWVGKNMLGLTLHATPENIDSREALQNKISDLERELVQAHVVLKRYKVLEDENVSLKELLGRSVYTHSVLASVLARPALTPYDTLLIDVGEGFVKPGDRVAVEGSIVLGTISEVHGETAQVELFSAPGVETEVLIGSQRIPVTAKGQGGGSFVAEFPRDAEVAQGDAVVLPGINPYLFASVESTEASASEPFITVRFKNPINIQALTWVQVLTDASEVLKEPVGDPLSGTSTGTSTSQ